MQTYGLPTARSCRAWTQRARSPHSRAVLPFLTATEGYVTFVLLVFQTRIFPLGRSHHCSLPKPLPRFMPRWLTSNTRSEINAEKGESAERLLGTFQSHLNNSFVWTTFSKPAGTARPFQIRALEQRVLFLAALILLWKCTEAPSTLVSMCVTEGRKGVFQSELPAFPWEPAGLAQSGLFSAPTGNAARQEGGPGAPSLPCVAEF